MSRIAPLAGANPKPVKTFKRPPWQRASKPPRLLGKIGLANQAFSRRKRKEWSFRYGPALASAIAPHETADLVVGHVLGKDIAPERRWDDDNVAPITRKQNREMEFDMLARRAYEPQMLAWIERDKLLRRKP